ncbi:hypothetical protein [Arthrobacter sp. QXT-31]|uniref:hypothetical protein n=1 Tax=Arthrobacter sp. QXT-31 TaxID=1357915 RepID=UPI000971ACDC|nr:hypothetical protein [Arthrobacter sp. QXT-31]APX00378.1 hypothetical protein BWQ92_00275 [Arthrobacter sp. QXT-31]
MPLGNILTLFNATVALASGLLACLITAMHGNPGAARFFATASVVGLIMAGGMAIIATLAGTVSARRAARVEPEVLESRGH